MIRRALALALTHRDIGSTVSATVSTDEGSLPVSGVLRWYTVDSSLITVALEEGEDTGAVEWHVPFSAVLSILDGAR